MRKYTLGDGPIEAQYKEEMATIARSLDVAFNGERAANLPGLPIGTSGQPRKTGFVLMVFPFDGFDGRCNYISNGADRKDIVILMKEMIARFEGQPEVSGRA